MARTVDQRIVQMSFDNSKFENAAQKTLSTLQQLKGASDMKGAGKGLSSLSNAFGNFNLGPVASAIDTINSRFSTMGIVGMTVIQDLTHKAMQLGSSLVNAVSAPIMEGGFNRAMKIENAKFMLDGLLNDADKVKEVMDNVDAAVTGTAYGMDAAANVASQLVASGVQAGEGLTSTLKSVAGVAAMTNSSYEDIGAIFSTVYGQGKLMTMQLRQLEGRGMNAAAIMAEEFGTTEEAIRQMVTDGQISAEMFTQAMLRFEESAGKANETFNGVTANIRSALARTGQAFYTPFLEQNSEFIQFLGTVRTKISDEMNKSEGMTMLVEAVVNDIYKVIRFANKVVQEFDIQGLMAGIFNLYDASESVAQLIFNSVIKPIQAAFQMSGVKMPTMDGFVEATRSISEFFASIKDNNYGTDLHNVMRGIISAVQIATRVFKDFWEVTEPIRSLFVDILSAAGRALGIFGLAIENVNKELNSGWKQYHNLFAFLGPAITAIVSVVRHALDIFNEWADGNLYDGILDGFSSIKTFASSTGTVLGSFTKVVVDTVKSIVDFIKNGQVFQKLIDGVRGAIDKISPYLERGRDGVKTFFQSFSGETDEMDASEKFSARVGLFQGVLEKFLGVLKALGRVVKSILDPVGQAIKNFLGEITVKDVTDLGWLGLAAVIGQSVKNLLDTIATATNQFKNGRFEILVTNFNDTLVTISRSLSGFQTAIKAYMDVQYLKTLAITLAILAGSIALLAFIPADRITNAAVALGYASLIMVATVKALQTNISLLKDFDMAPLVAMVVAVSVAMALMAGAIAKMAKASRNGGLGAGIIGMIVSMVALVTAVKVLSNTMVDLDIRGLALLVVIAHTIASLSKSIVRLAKIEDGMDQALAVIVMLSGLIMGIVMVAGIVSFNNVNANNFLGLAVMILAITSLVKRIEKLAKLDLKGVGVAVLAITGVLLSIAGFIALLGFIFRSGGGFGGGDAGILIGVSAGMILMSVAVRILASSIKALADLKMENLQNAVSGLVIVLLALAGACFVLSRSAIGAGALLVIAAALAIITPILLTIGGLFGTVIVGILGLAVALTALTAAAVIFGPFVLYFILLSVGLLALSVGITALGASLLILDVAIGVFAASSVALVQAIQSIVKGVADLIPYIIKKIVEGIEVFFTSIAAATPRIIGAVAMLIISLLELVVAFIPAFAQVTLQFIVTILDTLIEYGPTLVQRLLDFLVTVINALADGIRNNAEPILNAIRNLISSIIEFVFIAIREITEGWGPLGKAIGGLMDGAQSGAHKLITGNDLEKQVKEQNAELVSELESGSEAAGAAGEKVGSSYFDGLKNSILGGSDGEGGGIMDAITNQFSLGTDQFKGLGSEGGAAFGGGFLESIMGTGEEGGGIMNQFSGMLSQDTTGTSESGKAHADAFLGGYEEGIQGYDITNLTNSFNLDFLTGAQNATPSMKDAGVTLADDTMGGFEEEMVQVAAPGGQAFAAEINSGFEQKTIEVAAPSGEGYGTQIMSGLEDKKIEEAAAGGGDFAQEIDTGFDNKVVEVAAPSGEELGNQIISGVAAKHEDASLEGEALAMAGVEGTKLADDDWYSAGENSGKGYVSGLRSQLEAAKSAGAALVTAANGATKTTAEIQSPSRLWKEDGVMSGLGYVLGIKDTADDAKAAGKSLVDNARAGLASGFGEVGAEGTMKISPVIDFDSMKSNIAAAGNINLQNAKLATTSMLNADINAKLMADNQIAELKRQEELQMVQNGIQTEMLNYLRAVAGHGRTLDGIRTALNSRQDVVLDTGVVVGQLVGRMDSALGDRANRRARGS